MRKLTFIILVSLGLNIAIASDDAKPAEQLRNEIVKLLQSPRMELENNEAQAVISFTITTERELVVLSVKSENKLMDSFVKARLNYKKVDYNVIENGQVSRIPLKIVIKN